MLRSVVAASILSIASVAHAGESGLAIGGRMGVTSLTMTKEFDLYLGPGATVGAELGWAFSRHVATSAAYEWSAVGGDERNAGAPPGSSQLLGGALRLRSNTADSAGLYFETLLGVRWISYHFHRNDGLTGDAWTLPSGPTAEATLRGWDLRFAMGISAPITEALSMDTFVALGFGRMLRYTDTLDCATFRPGPCGGSYDFTTGTLGLSTALHYH